MNLESIIALLATNGLIFFRKGNIHAGRFLYKKAIMLAERNNLNKMANHAQINLTREEILNSTAESNYAFNEMIRMTKKSESDDLIEQRKKVEKLFLSKA